eukprot:TRINITY_DN7209_c0_g1_i1.p1 TRINITY_DN7209_c0_g1~~TRINITY_DN7209_c0_g1_i1.p1  ORF type:complete len:254 (-),score=41.91 TRINITY_DN7209_c0_g1_i1:47-760(-)
MIDEKYKNNNQNNYENSDQTQSKSKNESINKIQSQSSQNDQNLDFQNSNQNSSFKIVDKKYNKFNQFIELELCQLRLSYLLYQINGKEKLIFPDDLQQHCMHALQKEAKRKQYKENELLPKVLEVVKQKYPYAQERVLILNGEFQVHICICGHDRRNDMHAYNNMYDMQQRKVALEIFTTNNFVANRGHLVVGYTLSKIELLVGFGWRVVIVSSYEWDDKGYQQQMLKTIEKALTEQ